MRYISTRGEAPAVSFSEAVAHGLAPDGGLYLPESLPDLSGQLDEWAGLPYPELCFAFLRLFADDLDEAVLSRVTSASYVRFDSDEVAPIVPLGENLSVLELFHGPTLAFKDFALQLLGNLYGEQIRRTGEPITVLGATSGDTGAAAIEGLLGKEGVTVFILYPDGRVSPLQERQMTCTGADNVYPLAVSGTFDDAQTALKEVFNDLPFKRRVGLSAVNSINLARILAQSAYYLSAWLRLPRESREDTVFVVPTGNFGNVLAGWIAKSTGASIDHLLIASNANDILARFVNDRDMSATEVVPTLSPSMDIQVSSNFERLLFEMNNRNGARTAEQLQHFRSSGTLEVEEANFRTWISPTFSAERLDDEETLAEISRVYRDSGMLIDPHTATGTAAARRSRSTGATVCLSTAHPAKFPDAVEKATGIRPELPPELGDLMERSERMTDLPADLAAVSDFVRGVSRVSR